jgi:hypothetical protein
MNMLGIRAGKDGEKTSRFMNYLGECREAFVKRVGSLMKIKPSSYKHQR